MSPLRNPLSARSVLLSVLLGTDPPRLPVALLVSTTELFGIAEGTTRTALSRMAAAGEVTTADGWYEIASPRLLRRQARQEQSRHGRTESWDGTWISAVVVADGRRPAAERAALRTELTAARLAELREGVWMRPDNLGDRPAVDADELGWFATTPLDDPVALGGRLWDLAGWGDTATALQLELRLLTPGLAGGDRTALADGFVLSADVLRHLQADPLLPPDLLPPAWPGADLRADYDRFDAAYRAVIRAWFDQHR